MDNLKYQDEKYWKKKLTSEQYKTLRTKGTDVPFTGKYVDNHEDGTYHCVACGNKLFESGTKFDSGSGWPSFYDVAVKGNVEIMKDYRHGMVRTEITCAKCGSHLGHLFDDGPADKNGQRYCVNSTALDFKISK